MNRTHEQRVHDALRWLTLIRAAVHVPDDIVDAGELADAVDMAAVAAKDAIEPLRHVPAKVANWTPKGGGR